MVDKRRLGEQEFATRSRVAEGDIPLSAATVVERSSRRHGKRFIKRELRALDLHEVVYALSFLIAHLNGRFTQVLRPLTDAEITQLNEIIGWYAEEFIRINGLQKTLIPQGWE